MLAFRFLISKSFSLAKYLISLRIDFPNINRFIVGYGMDYNEYLRDIRHITVLNEVSLRNHYVHRLYPHHNSNGTFI